MTRVADYIRERAAESALQVIALLRPRKSKFRKVTRQKVHWVESGHVGRRSLGRERPRGEVLTEWRAVTCQTARSGCPLQFVVISLKDNFYSKAHGLVGIYRDRQQAL